MEANLPFDFANDHLIGEVEHTLFVETAVINRIVVAFSEQLDYTISVDLLRRDSVHDGDVLTINFIHDDVSILDGCVKGED